MKRTMNAIRRVGVLVGRRVGSNCHSGDDKRSLPVAQH